MIETLRNVETPRLASTSAINVKFSWQKSVASRIKLVQSVIVSVMALDYYDDDKDDADRDDIDCGDDDKDDDGDSDVGDDDHVNGDDDDDDCEGQAPRADVLFERRRRPCWIHGQQVSPSSSLLT